MSNPLFPVKMLLTVSTTSDAAVPISFTFERRPSFNPFRMFFPISTIFPGSALMALRILVPTSRTTPTAVFAIDFNPVAREEIPLEPMVFSAAGILESVVLMELKILPAVVFIAGPIDLIPSFSAVIRFFPSDSQLNAKKALTIACMIFGIFFTNVGMAFTNPMARFLISVSAATTSFGALSLIMPAILMTIWGMVSISVGRF